MKPRASAAHRTPAPPRPDSTRARVFPTLGEIFSIRGPFLVPLLILIVTRAAMAYLTPSPAEDAYITFRYARNLASGHGLVYNPGERVMGFTSPLWTLWSALGIALLKDPVLWSRIWALIADVITLLVGGAMIARSVSTLAAACFTFFFAAWPYFAAVSVSGLEMSPCVMALVLSAALVGATRRAAGPALGALALLRPEGLLAAAIIAIGARPRDRWIALAIVAVAAGALAAWFGSPLPSSVTSKALVYGAPGPLAGRVWWEWLSPAILGRWPAASDGIPLTLLTVVAAPAFIAGAITLGRSWRTPLSLAAAAATAIWLGYSLVGVTYFWWYLVFPLFAMTLVASVGLPSVVRGRGILVAMGLYVITVWSMSWNLYVGRAKTEADTFGAMAQALRERCAPGDTVMLEPIGIIGFNTPVVVIDETGLVTPAVAERRRQGEGWYADLVKTRRPDWLVLRLGVLNSQEAFAGVGRPFRSQAERDTVLSRYRMVGQSGATTDASTLALLQRVGGQP